MKLTIATLAILLSLTPAMAFSEPDTCSFAQSRKVFKDWRPLSNMLTAYVYRRDCGVASGTDRAALLSIPTALGCGPDSGIGAYFKDTLDLPITPETEHPGIASIRHGDPVGYYNFCRMAQHLSWPEQDASFLLRPVSDIPEAQIQHHQAFWAHVDAMQNYLTRLMLGL